MLRLKKMAVKITVLAIKVTFLKKSVLNPIVTRSVTKSS